MTRTVVPFGPQHPVLAEPRTARQATGGPSPMSIVMLEPREEEVVRVPAS